MRRHLTNYFKGLPDFKPTRLRLVTSLDVDELFATLDYVAERWGGYDLSGVVRLPLPRSLTREKAPVSVRRRHKTTEKPPLPSGNRKNEGPFLLPGNGPSIMAAGSRVTAHARMAADSRPAPTLLQHPFDVGLVVLHLRPVVVVLEQRRRDQKSAEERLTAVGTL